MPPQPSAALREAAAPPGSARDIVPTLAQQAALARIARCLSAGERVILLTGEPGIGKSVAAATLAAEPPEGFAAVSIGFWWRGTDPVAEFRRALADRAPRGRALMICDAADGLDPEALARLADFARAGADGAGEGAALVIAGGPALADRLAGAGLTATAVEIGPMTRRESDAFLRARFRARGLTEARISDTTLAAMHDAARGNPRRLKALVERSFLPGTPAAPAPAAAPSRPPAGPLPSGAGAAAPLPPPLPAAPARRRARAARIAASALLAAGLVALRAGPAGEPAPLAPPTAPAPATGPARTAALPGGTRTAGIDRPSPPRALVPPALARPGPRTGLPPAAPSGQSSPSRALAVILSAAPAPEAPPAAALRAAPRPGPLAPPAASPPAPPPAPPAEGAAGAPAGSHAAPLRLDPVPVLAPDEAAPPDSPPAPAGPAADALSALLATGVGGHLARPRSEDLAVALRLQGGRILFVYPDLGCEGVLEPAPDGAFPRLFRERPFPGAPCGDAGWVRLDPEPAGGLALRWAPAPEGPWAATAWLRAEAGAARPVGWHVPAERAAADPELREALMALLRAERIEIQRRLMRAGFDPQGIDGFFGAATRTAIAAWQRARGLPATGYLDPGQLDRLAAETGGPLETAGARR